MMKAQMNSQVNRYRVLSCGIAVAAALLCAAPVVSPAWAAESAASAGYGESDLVSVRATVTALDLEKHTITLAGPEGGEVTMTFGKNVANIDKIKVGDPVIARYYEAVTYVLSPPNTKLPEDSLAAATASTPPGGLPAGAVATRLTVTGLIVGVNQHAHTISLVDPDGGKVRTLAVKSAEGQEMMKTIKVGDTITAYFSEALAVAIEPAK